jgi:hypothetical protein
MAKKKKSKAVKLPNLHESFLYYGPEVEWDTVYEHDHDEMADSYDAFRYPKMVNVRVTSVNIDRLVSELCDKMNLKKKGDEKHKVLRYCVDRILRLLRVYDPDMWDVGTCRRYYGDELDKVELIHTKAQEVSECLENLLSADNPIEFVLKMEYHHLLPELEGQKWEVKSVYIKDVIAGSDHQMRKVDREAEEVYQNYDGPIGICLRNNDGYRLIDGYHRFWSAKKNNKRTVKIVVN